MQAVKEQLRGYERGLADATAKEAAGAAPSPRATDDMAIVQAKLKSYTQVRSQSWHQIRFFSPCHESTYPPCPSHACEVRCIRACVLVGNAHQIRSTSFT